MDLISFQSTKLTFFKDNFFQDMSNHSKTLGSGKVPCFQSRQGFSSQSLIIDMWVCTKLTDVNGNNMDFPSKSFKCRVKNPTELESNKGLRNTGKPTQHIPGIF